eukprot:scaffold27633_cov50-Attheya_sp.AAC.2
MADLTGRDMEETSFAEVVAASLAATRLHPRWSQRLCIEECVWIFRMGCGNDRCGHYTAGAVSSTTNDDDDSLVIMIVA